MAEDGQEWQVLGESLEMKATRPLPWLQPHRRRYPLCESEHAREDRVPHDHQHKVASSPQHQEAEGNRSR